MADHLLTEAGDALLQETGSQILLVPGDDRPFGPTGMTRALATAAVFISTVVTVPPTATVEAAAPFRQDAWPAPSRAQAPSRTVTIGPIPSTLDTVPVPFSLTHWPPTVRVRRDIVTVVTRPGDTPAAPAEPLPLNQYQWPKPVRRLEPQTVRTWFAWLTPDDSVPIIPIAFPKPSRLVVRAPRFDWAPNLIPIQSVTPPFIPIAFPKPVRAVDWKDRSFGRNQVLGQIAEVVPVGQTSISRQVPKGSGITWVLNLQGSTLSAIVPPFIPIEWPKPQRAKPPAVPFDWSPNSVLRQVAESLPVGQIAISRQVPTLSGRTWVLNLQGSTLQDVVPPFIPIEWARPLRAKSPAVPFDWAPNLVLRQVAEVVPVGQASASRQVLKPSGRTWALNLLQSTLSDVVAPFVPVEWPSPQRAAIGRRLESRGLWLAVLEQHPFSQLEWPTPAPKRRAPKFYDLPNNVLKQVAEPLPVNQYQWPPPAQWRRNPALRGYIQDGGLRLAILSQNPATPDCIILVRPDVGIIEVRGEIGVILVLPDVGDVEV